MTVIAYPPRDPNRCPCCGRRMDFADYSVLIGLILLIGALGSCTPC